MKQRIICFDVGKSKIAQAVIEINKADLSYIFLDFLKIDNPVDKAEIEKIILDYCQKSKKEFNTQKVGVASAKIVNSEKKEVLNAEDVFGINSFSFVFLKKEEFDLKLENDGHCFAKGEYIFGKAKGAESVLTLTVGTHLGGGFVNQEGALQGVNNSAMEVSHIKICLNEKWFSWHELVGGKSIERKYEEMTGKIKKSQDIFELEKHGDKKAQAVIKKSNEFLGVGIANLINILDPEQIIIGGGLANQNFFIEKSFQIAQSHIFNKKGIYQFKISSLKEKANLLGVAWQYFI